MVAYRFKTSCYRRHIKGYSDICFNDSYRMQISRSFDLMVWDDNDGDSGNVIYSQAEDDGYTGTKIQRFLHLHFTEWVTVNYDTFYVGWKQRSETFLNAGFDVNTPNPWKTILLA